MYMYVFMYIYVYIYVYSNNKKFQIIPLLTMVLKYGITSHLNLKLSLVKANLRLM